MSTKFCKKCGTAKPLNMFYRDASKPDGLHALCKECKNENKRRYRDEHGSDYSDPDKKAAADRAARAAYIARREVENMVRDFEMEHSGVTVSREQPWPINVERMENARAAFLDFGVTEYPLRRRHIQSLEYDLAVYATVASGIRHEVDHIVPLRGLNFCGLDVARNLQAVPKGYNQYKQNRLEKGTGWGEEWSFSEVGPPDSPYYTPPDETTMRGLRLQYRGQK